MLAKALQCKVRLMFSYRQGKKVMLTIMPFAEQVILPRTDKDQALQAYMQQYATALEQQCRESPLQWFNFYPFWTDSPR